MADPQLTALAHDQMPLTALLGLEIERGDRDEVVGTARWAPERCTAAGVLHGGFLQTDVVRVDGKLVTRTTQTQAVIGPPA